MTDILKILIIEDDSEHNRQLEEWLPTDFKGVFVTSAGRAIELLERDNYRDNSHVYAGIMLDHEIQQQVATGDDQDLSGATVVKSIIKNMSGGIPVLVHSSNLKQAIHMEEKLSDAGFIVTRMPMNQMDKDFFRNWLAGVKANWLDLF